MDLYKFYNDAIQAPNYNEKEYYYHLFANVYKLDIWTTTQILMRIQSLTEYLKTHSFLLQMQSISTENKPKQMKRKVLFQLILIKA